MATNHTTEDDEQLPRDGSYFLKRDRNKERTLGIYTVKSVTSRSGKTSNQTVRVASTDTSDPARAEIALKRFVLNDKEATQKSRERQASGEAPSEAIDRPILEVMNLYFLGKIDKRRIDEQERLAAAIASNDHEQAELLTDNVRRATVAANAVRASMKIAYGAWPENPRCSKLNRDMQKVLVEHCRKIGLSDNTIKARLSFIWAAMNWCDAGGKLGKFPRLISTDEWEANCASSSEGAYEIEELARLFKAAEDDPEAWKFMVCDVATASRPMAVIRLRRKQIDLARGICKLNPPGRRQTKKRRATVKMCPTFIAEVSQWDLAANDHVVGLRSYRFYEALSEKAGVTGGAMRIRHTVRSWLAANYVSDAEADVFVGHAEEGSATGRRWYKHLKPDYLQRCVEAIEKLFIEIARINGRPFAGMKPYRPTTLVEMIRAWAPNGAANELAFVAEAHV